MLGKTISHYKIIEKLGEGGMGIIYKALDTKLNRTVALKFLAQHLLASPEEKTRFYQEAQAAASLDHPHICTIYEIDEVENQTFIAMAYLEGQTLKERLESGTPTLEEAAGLALQITEGLKAAHEQGIVHRDIKSSNIMITKNNQAKILDFGLAKWSGSTVVTKEGSTRGTVAYMSPEQAQGVAVDHRTDVWSLGVVLYEMLTAQLPFKGEHFQAVIYSILNEEPLPISTLRTEVPKEWEKIVNKCLQKNPAQRYQSVTELQIDLKKAMHQMGLRELAEQFKTTVKKPIFASALSKISFAAAGLLLTLALLWLFPSSQKTLKGWLGIKPSAFEKHLVVLPFTNIGGDPTKQAFCDGVTETINQKLSQLEQFQSALRVVPASDVTKSKISSAEEAGKIFGANLVVSGGVQDQEDSVRLSLILIDTKTLRQLKSFVTRYHKAHFAFMQDMIVKKLAQVLEIELTPQARGELARGHTAFSKAYISYLYGRGYLKRSGKDPLDLAIDFLQKATQEDSLYGLAYQSLGEAYWRKYDATKSVEWIQIAEQNSLRALQLDDSLTSAHVSLGIIFKGSGRFPEAVAEFKKALELDSLSAEAIRGLAGAYESMGETEKAESTYHKAIQLRPNLWVSYNHLGAFYFRKGRYEEALEQFQRVVHLNPYNSSTFNNLGQICILLKRPPDARECFERSLAIQPNYVAYSGLGNLYFFQESRYEEAAQMYQKALELDSSDYRVWGGLASASYWSLGLKNKAKSFYRRAAQMAEVLHNANPRDATLLSHLADFYSMLGEKNKSLTLVEQSLVLAPSDVEVMARAGETYEQLGLREKALEWVEKALRKGYSLTMVERSPGLKQLRADIRFQHLTQKLADKNQKQR